MQFDKAFLDIHFNILISTCAIASLGRGESRNGRREGLGAKCSR